MHSSNYNRLCKHKRNSTFSNFNLNVQILQIPDIYLGIGTASAQQVVIVMMTSRTKEYKLRRGSMPRQLLTGRNEKKCGVCDSPKFQSFRLYQQINWRRLVNILICHANSPRMVSYMYCSYCINFRGVALGRFDELFEL